MENILLERQDGKAIITINRPAKRNALNKAAYLEIKQVLEELNSDSSVRAIIFTGAGDVAFCAGGDIAEEALLEKIDAYKWFQLGHEIYSLIEKSPKPVIAAINGYCLGGGFELILACDLRICTASAKMGTPEPKLGVTCGFGGNIRLPRLIGKGKAKEILMTGKMIDAEEAYRIGLVNEIAPDGRLMEVVDSMCAELLNKSAIVLDLIKRSVDNGLEIDFNSAIQLDCALATIGFSTEDKAEGMAAFLEKRSPVFKDK